MTTEAFEHQFADGETSVANTAWPMNIPAWRYLGVDDDRGEFEDRFARFLAEAA